MKYMQVIALFLSVLYKSEIVFNILLSYCLTLMEAELTTILNHKGLIYVKIDDESSLNKIYYLWVQNIKSMEPTNAIEYAYYGLYYKHVHHDDEKMEQYYLKGIELGDVCSMNNLGYYYRHSNTTLAEQYYLMAVKLNCPTAMFRLGSLYKGLERTDEANHYYILAAKYGDKSAHWGYIETYSIAVQMLKYAIQYNYIRMINYHIDNLTAMHEIHTDEFYHCLFLIDIHQIELPNKCLYLRSSYIDKFMNELYLSSCNYLSRDSINRDLLNCIIAYL